MSSAIVRRPGAGKTARLRRFSASRRCAATPASRYC